MRSDFIAIENYKRMLQCLEEQKDFPNCDDQQMSDSSPVMLPEMQKAIKVEEPYQQDFCSLADMFTDNINYESDMLTESSQPVSDINRTFHHIPQSDAVYSDSKDFSLTLASISSDSSNTISSTTAGPSMSSNFSTVESSQPLQMVPQSLSTSASFSSPSSSPTVIKAENGSKTRTFVTELGGSGCTVITNSTNFPSNTSHSYFDEAPHGDLLEYTDLDKQEPFDSSYGSIKASASFTNPKRTFHTQGSTESGSLDDAVQFMQNIIQQDSDNLEIPFDPQLWTRDHVWRWVEWVYHKNDLCDLPKHLACLNGQLLCSWSYDEFYSHCGQAGSYLYNELDLWKAANSCSPNVSKSPSQTVPCQTTSSPPNNFLGINNAFSFSPASSPSLSPNSNSSSSPDSSSYLLSQRSDIPEEDSLFYSGVTTTTTTKSESSANDKSKLFRKRVPGRGHKKSIVLWQFLRRLLLSDQNYGCIRWIDRKAGIFKIEDSKKVATLWGAEKNLPNMNYDKLSRSVRQYYRKGIIKKPEQSKRLLYQFCPEYL